VTRLLTVLERVSGGSTGGEGWGAGHRMKNGRINSEKIDAVDTI